jgi:hypothetical protein
MKNWNFHFSSIDQDGYAYNFSSNFVESFKQDNPVMKNRGIKYHFSGIHTTLKIPLLAHHYGVQFVV